MTDPIRDLLISLSSHMAYMQGHLEARHELDDPEDYYWYRESVLLRQKVTDALADEPAVPQDREPAAVTGQPSDEEIMGLMPQQMHEDLAYAARAMANEAGTDNRKAKGFMRIALNRHAVDLARAVLARWGSCQGILDSSAPAPAGEVGELIGKLVEAAPALAEMGWDQHAQRILRAADLLQHLSPPQPPAEGEVAELVAELRMMASQAAEACQFTDAESLSRAADLLERQATACAICERERLHQSTRAADLEVERQAAPVLVSERLPGQEDCDKQGRCWWWRTDDADEWWELLCIRYSREYNARCGNARYTHWLPAHALPVPGQEVEG